MKFKLLFLSAILLVWELTAAAQGPVYPYSVVLTWTPSTSSDVTAQTVERAPYTSGACGSYTVLSATLAPATATYTDTTVGAGVAYCYGVIAVAGTAQSPPDVVTNIQIGPAPPTGLTGIVN
jgi:hypothetical protein